VDVTPAGPAVHGAAVWTCPWHRRDHDCGRHSVVIPVGAPPRCGASGTAEQPRWCL